MESNPVGWVRSADATSVLCRPPNFQGVCQISLAVISLTNSTKDYLNPHQSQHFISCLSLQSCNRLRKLGQMYNLLLSPQPLFFFKPLFLDLSPLNFVTYLSECQTHTHTHTPVYSHSHTPIHRHACSLSSCIYLSAHTHSLTASLAHLF